MKLRIAMVLILLGLFDATVHAQNNCCNIVPGPVQTSGGVTVILFRQVGITPAGPIRGASLKHM